MKMKPEGILYTRSYPESDPEANETRAEKAARVAEFLLEENERLKRALRLALRERDEMAAVLSMREAAE